MDKKRRQVRYALVLQGGVSLAIWMGGVTHELNRIRLASEELDSERSEPESSNPWIEILKAANRTAVVDLIAGTSAGGLNGAILATAVARGADLPDMCAKWESLASLDEQHLIWEDPKKARSLFDGDYFEQAVRDILAEVKAVSDPANSCRVKPRDCTLLLTATALESPALGTKLETGATMWRRDGRRVYKFARTKSSSGGEDGAMPEHRAGQNKNDFDAIDELVLAARASASFPIAFAPVWETDALRQKREGSREQRKVGPTWLVDGGVLDNAPFEPLIEALARTPANSPYDRIMLYVTPGAGRNAPMPPSLKPPPLRLTLGSVISALQQPNERLDSDAIGEIFRQMSFSRSQAYHVIYEYLNNPMDATTRKTVAEFQKAAAIVFDRYRWSRAEGFQRWLESLSPDQWVSPLQPQLEAEIDPKAIPGMPPPPFPAIAEGAEVWQWGWSVADRILRWWGRALTKLEPTETLAKAMQCVAEQQQEVTEMRPQLEEVVRGRPRAAQITAFKERYESGSDAWGRRLGKLINNAVSEIHKALPASSIETLLELSLSVEVLANFLDWRGDDYDVPEFRFHNVNPAVDIPPGIDLGPVSQRDDWPDKKLYGQRLNHFGAFISPENRRHDWLWGRLDGASELSKQLLTSAVGGNSTRECEELRRKLINNILNEEVGGSPQWVKDGAVKAYGETGKDLLHTMHKENEGGIAKLEQTFWTLSYELGTIGYWMRCLLSPDWPEKSRDGAKLPAPLGVRFVRLLTWLPRNRLRSTIKRRVFGDKLHS